MLQSGCPFRGTQLERSAQRGKEPEIKNWKNGGQVVSRVVRRFTFSRRPVRGFGDHRNGRRWNWPWTPRTRFGGAEINFENRKSGIQKILKIAPIYVLNFLNFLAPRAYIHAGKKISLTSAINRPPRPPPPAPARPRRSTVATLTRYDGRAALLRDSRADGASRRCP